MKKTKWEEFWSDDSLWGKISGTILGFIVGGAIFIPILLRGMK